MPTAPIIINKLEDKQMRISKVIIFMVSMLFLTHFAFTQDFDALKAEIHSKLRDKRCNMPLSECSCPEAKEMKGYIDALLETGTAKDEIYYKVAKKFSLKTILDENVKKELEKRLTAEAGENRPQIVLESNSFNFGEVKKDQGKVSTVFKLSNQGNVALVIKNIKASCTCTTASLSIGKDKSPYFDTKGAPADWQMEIKPKEKAELEVVLDLAHNSVKLGDLMREVIIVSNDSLYPELSVRVEAKVLDREFSGQLEDGIRVIKLKASKYKFEPDPMVVKKGEKIRLVAASSDVPHGISIADFKVNLTIPAGKSNSVEFIADKEGSFPVHCSVFCGPDHNKMRGTLIVK